MLHTKIFKIMFILLMYFGAMFSALVPLKSNHFYFVVMVIIAIIHLLQK